MISKPISLMFACALTFQVVAQQPDWSVETNDFANSMNVIGFVSIDGIESEDKGDVVAAFIDGEVRGVASPVYVEDVDRYVVFLPVFSNTSSGSVTFKIYDASSDKVIDAKQTVAFLSDGLIGGLEESFLWSNKELNGEALITSFEITSQFGQSTISDFTISISVSLKVGESVNAQFATFTVSEGAIITLEGVVQESGTLQYDFSRSIAFKVQSEDLLTINEYEVRVVVVNNAPTALSIDNSQVSENASVATLVGLISTTDSNSNDSHIYELVAGDGAEDNGLFRVSGNNLLTEQIINFEEGETRSVRLSSTDGYGEVVESIFLIDIIDLNESPTDILLTNLSINENSAAGTVIGSLSTIDQDELDSFTYEIVSGNGDDNKFVIEDNTLVSSESFNHEEQSVLQIRIRSTDSDGEKIEKQFKILVQNVNDSPTGIQINSNSVEENSPSNTLVGLFNTIDQDIDDTFTYELVGGGDNGLFTINENELRTINTFDFEEKTNYAVRVQSTDQAGSNIVVSFEVIVTDTNDVPDEIIMQGNTVPENSAIGFKIGQFDIVDQDPTDKYDYILKRDVADNEFFGINNGNELVSTIEFDFETQPSLQIIIEAIDDSGNRFEKEFEVNVLNVPEAGLIISKDTLDFSSTEIGTSKSVSFTITNDGPDGVLEITSFDLPENFTIIPEEVSLVPSETRDFILIFRPESEGVFSDRVTIISNIENKEVFLKAGASLVTSLEESSYLTHNVKIYPSPAVDFFHVETSVFKSRPYEIELFDIRNGASIPVQFEEYPESLRISTSKLISGFYLIVLKNSDLFVKKKVFVLK